MFNADEVDGLNEVPAAASVRELQDVDGFSARTEAKIIHGGNRACFIPKPDEIHMPSREVFTGSASSTRTETYYSTLLHELIHWTALPHRCDRQVRALWHRGLRDGRAGGRAGCSVPSRSLGSRLSRETTMRNTWRTG